jgi:hypothetical protein
MHFSAINLLACNGPPLFNLAYHLQNILYRKSSGITLLWMPGKEAEKAKKQASPDISLKNDFSFIND